MDLFSIETPALVLDEAKMNRNLQRLRAQLPAAGVRFRPHLKTSKSVEVARRLMETPAGPATVSTLQEAEQLAAHGVRDLLYAVGIAPHRLDRVVALRRVGADLTIILDSEAQARAVTDKAREADDPLPVLIEIDCDGHRGGLKPDDPLLPRLGAQLVTGGAELRGVLTHAGASYDCRSPETLGAAADQERRAAVAGAEALRAAGLPCPVVSVGSTPTALYATAWDGVTELRAGVFAFFDLVMAGIGVCSLDDIALSVLATVIGHQPDRDWTLIDAGWMALSRDRGTAAQAIDQGYGLVCDMTGRLLPDLVVEQANQEHGIIVRRPGAAEIPPPPVGTRLRILPNHACATAAQHDRYHVVGPGSCEVRHVWDRMRGW